VEALLGTETVGEIFGETDRQQRRKPHR
jgi:hypothetical protein